MRLTTKGLLLVAIPAALELALLSGIVKAQADVTDAQRWAVHSQDVLRETSSILRPMQLESVRLRGVVISGEPGGATPVSLWMDIDRRIDRLTELVADNPAQVERAVQIRQAVQAYRQWSDRAQDLLDSGRRHDLAERFRDRNADDVLDLVRTRVAAFQQEERRLDEVRTHAAQTARVRQQRLIMAAVIGSIVFVAVAFGLFAHGVRGRLAKLSDNARRLAQNEPLAERLPGADEIARLDEALHQTSRRLRAAERLQARFQHDLARRAGELAHINETLRQQTRENELFIYSVSHDLRSPLVNLQGFSKELIHACDDLRRAVRESSLNETERARIERLIDDDISLALRYLQTAVLRASHIIDALLRLSRVGRVEYRQQQVDIADIVQRVIDAMQMSIRARGVHVIVHELPPVWGDPTALEQVFGNLLGNAVNYLDPSREGRVEIGTTAAPLGMSSLRIFYVKDNGLGIPEAAMPRLFSAFQRLHGNAAAGEGIGLALVRRVVERHGGRVWAESEEGVGTTFYLSLPQAADARPDLLDVASGSASRGH